MRKVKVLLVSKFYPPVKGGVESHVKALAESIKEKFSTFVLCCNIKRRTEVEEKDGLKIVRVGSSLYLKRFKKKIWKLYKGKGGKRIYQGTHGKKEGL